MKRNIVAALMLGSAICNSQTLTGIEFSNPSANAGESTSLIAQLETLQGKSSWCGLLVSYGDGTTTDHRLDDSTIPLRLTHIYANPGTYTVVAEGKTIFRGFNTAASCGGSSKTTTITVIDPAQKQREQALRSELDAEQKKKLDALAEASRVQAADSQKRRSLEAQELDLKAREIELKRRELLAKEREILVREEELRNKEHATKKIPAPASRSTPAPKPPTETKEAKPSLLDTAQ